MSLPGNKRSGQIHEISLNVIWNKHIGKLNICYLNNIKAQELEVDYIRWNKMHLLSISNVSWITKGYIYTIKRNT